MVCEMKGAPPPSLSRSDLDHFFLRSHCDVVWRCAMAVRYVRRTAAVLVERMEPLLEVAPLRHREDLVDVQLAPVEPLLHPLAEVHGVHYITLHHMTPVEPLLHPLAEVHGVHYITSHRIASHCITSHHSRSYLQ